MKMTCRLGKRQKKLTNQAALPAADGDNDPVAQESRDRAWTDPHDRVINRIIKT